MGGSGALREARQGIFIPVAPEETSGASRTAGLERTGCADRAPGGINRGFVGGMGLLTSEQLTGRTTIAVARRLICECTAIEKSTVALVIDRAVLRACRSRCLVPPAPAPARHWSIRHQSQRSDSPLPTPSGQLQPSAAANGCQWPHL